MTILRIPQGTTVSHEDPDLQDMRVLIIMATTTTSEDRGDDNISDNNNSSHNHSSNNSSRSNCNNSINNNDDDDGVDHDGGDDNDCMSTDHITITKTRLCIFSSHVIQLGFSRVNVCVPVSTHNHPDNLTKTQTVLSLFPARDPVGVIAVLHVDAGSMCLRLSMCKYVCLSVYMIILTTLRKHQLCNLYILLTRSSWGPCRKYMCQCFFVVVCRLLNIPETCLCILGTDLCR